MFKIIPILTIDTSRLEPPYDKNGSVTPVTGINPTTTIKFRIVWKASENVNPNDKYFHQLNYLENEQKSAQEYFHSSNKIMPCILQI